VVNKSSSLLFVRAENPNHYDVIFRAADISSQILHNKQLPTVFMKQIVMIGVQKNRGYSFESKNESIKNPKTCWLVKRPNQATVFWVESSHI
jgi:hypothetical protein